MKSKITKLAATAVIIAGVFIGIYYFSSINGTSVAFAEVIQNIRTSGYTFDLNISIEGQTSPFTMKAMVLKPGLMRLDSPSGAGQISSIIDTTQNKSLLLFHQYNSGQIMENPVPSDSHGAGGIFALCGRPMENLWNMLDGSETPLGEKEIDGQMTEGFNIFQEDEYFQYETSIWADIQTAVPVLVEIISTSHDSSEESITLKWILSNFTLNVEMDESLFSLKVPTGYTLAYQKDLNELEAKPVLSNEEQKIIEALELWNNSEKNKAIEVLMSIDWEKPIEFSGRPYFFSMTEKDYISLRPDDQNEAIEQIMATSTTIRQITYELVALGEDAESSEDYEKAEHYFSTGIRFGKLIGQNKDAMIIVRLVGIAAAKKSLDEIINLYTKTGQQEKLQKAQNQFEALEEEAEKIKAKVTGQ
ncbi:MAG: hypothetical protein ACYSSP_07930 [Planctomycetota bacterium]|jgi:outer membrane lipoprotein-sorting protein